MLTKTAIVFFAFVATVSSARSSIRIPKPDESSGLIIEAMVNVVASCYGNDKLPIGFYGNSPETFLETLWSRKFIPILLLHHIKCFTMEERLYQQKLNIFVIVATDWQRVAHVFSYIGCRSRWSNRRASFLIVDWSETTEYGCHRNRTAEMFRIAWEYRVFNMNVLCLNATKGITIYTYNPYTDQAPAPWQLTEYLDKSPRHSKLSFFERKYQQNEVCENLDFDKLKDLGGSGIDYITAITGWNTHEVGSSSPYRRMLALDEEFNNIFGTFARQLHGAMKRISPRNRMDISLVLTNMHMSYEHHHTPHEMTYPYDQMDILVLTHFRGYKAQLPKILNIVDIYSQLGTCLVLLLSLIVFIFLAHQAVIPASLNIVRIICNTGFVNLPEDTAMKFYRVSVYLFMITMHGIFAGNLASLLTRDIPIDHPQTIKELVDGNYTIYFSSIYDTLFRNLGYEANFVELEMYGEPCIDYMISGGSMAACVAPAHEVLDMATDRRFYVSETPIVKQYRTFRTGPHWAFGGKLTKVLLIMAAADIIETLNMRVEKAKVSRVYSTDGPRIMTLNDLIFAFIILGIGLTCAFFSFIAEVSIGPICSAIAKIRQNPLYCFRRIKTDDINSRKVKVEKLKIKRVKVRTLNV